MCSYSGSDSKISEDFTLDPHSTQSTAEGRPMISWVTGNINHFITALLREQRQVCVRDCLYPKVIRYSITGADWEEGKTNKRTVSCLFIVLIIFSTVHVSLSTYNQGYLGNTRKVHLWLLSDNFKSLTSAHEGSGSTEYREELFMI